MTTRDAPLRFLSQLAPGAARKWRELGSSTYRGDISLATDNSEYRFHDGVFVSRAKRPQTFFDAPRSMRGLLLVGFLSEDDARDRWVLAPEWRAGSHAVLWRPDEEGTNAFVLTSPTRSFALERGEPEPDPWFARRLTGLSGIVKKVPRRIARPEAPSLRRPAAPSLTRLHSAAAIAPDG